MQMKKNTYKSIEELLPRYFDGQLSEEEQKKVEAWIHQSDKHYQLAREMHLLYLATDTLGVMQQVDTKRALQKIETRIRTRRIRLVLTWTQRIAAILFIPLLIAYLAQPFGQEKPEPRMLEVRTNPGTITRLTLPDGTKVSLNSSSTLTYPEQFGENRTVRLHGEAFFEVTKNPDKRFIVKTPYDAQIEVLGTTFNLETFERDSFISATLLSGRVDFITHSRKIRLNPREKIVYNIRNHCINRFQTTGESETSWKDGKIIFQNTPFNEAMRMLEKRYYVEFFITNSAYTEDTFTGSFINQRLDRILETFKISSGINWRYLSPKDKLEEKSRIEIY